MRAEAHPHGGSSRLRCSLQMASAAPFPKCDALCFTCASCSTCHPSRAAQLGSEHTLQADACFHRLFPSCAYSVEVRADAAAEAKHDACTARRAALKEKEERDGAKRPGAKAGVDRITQQLKDMSAEERTGVGSEEFRALKEARDLEDILFS